MPLRLLSTGAKKSIFRRILAGLLLLVIVAYNVAFYPPVFERIFLRLMSGSIPGQVRLHVEKSSLFRGFVFKDFEVRSEKHPFFRADRITLTYHMPSLLIGHIGIRDLSIARPEIFLTKTDGVWNTDEVFGPSTPAAAEPSKPLPEFINTYLALKLYGKIVVRDLHIHMETNDRVPELLDVDHFNMHAAFITRTFQRIPTGMRALDLFDTLLIGIAPDQAVTITRKAEGEIAGEIAFPFFLYKEVSRGSPEFGSRFLLDTSRLVLRKDGRSLAPRTKLYYNVSYNAGKDSLHLDRLLAEQSGEPWLDLTAEIEKITSNNPIVKMDMKQSRIDFSSVETILNYLGKGFGLRGTASLYPIHIEGPLDKLTLSGNVQASGFSMQTGKLIHSIPDLRLNLDASMDVQQYMPAEAGGKKEKPPNLAFGVFHKLLIPELFIAYNEATLRGNAKILPGEGILADVILSRLRLLPFSGPAFDGIASGQIRVQSPESFQDLKMHTELHISDARYRQDESRSGPMEMGLVSDCLIGMHEVTTVGLEKLLMTIQNPAGASLVTLKGSGDMSFGEGQDYRFQLQTLNINYGELHSTLPGSLRYSLSPYRSYLDGGLNISGAVGTRIAHGATSLTADAMIAMPGIHLDDLALKTSMSFSKEKTQIDLLKIAGLRGALSGDIHGSIVKAGEKSVPDLTINLGLASKTLFAVHKNLALQGGLLMDFKMQQDALRGNISAKDLSLELYSDCDANSVCKKTRIENMNLALPIFHDMRITNPAVLADAPASLTFDGAQYQGKPNLTVQFIASSHNPRGEIVKDGYFYAGSLLPGRSPGVAASLEYRKNVLYFKSLRYQIYRPRARDSEDLWVEDGRVEGKDVFFNLADLSPHSMEFGGKMQIQNLDLEPYLPASRSNYDGVISAELDFRGKDLGNALYNTNMRLSVYRLSSEFSGFAARVVMPAAMAGAIVKSALDIPSITVELQNGLVYTTIGIARRDIKSITKALSFLMKPTGEEIKQERIPLAQFLERARTEVEAGVKSEEPNP